MGMSVEDYLALTPSQFAGAYKRFLEKVESDRSHTEMLSWQVARWQVFRTLCPPRKQKITVFDLLQLPGDEAFRSSKKKNRPPRDETRFRKLAEMWK